MLVMVPVTPSLGGIAFTSVRPVVLIVVPLFTAIRVRPLLLLLLPSIILGMVRVVYWLHVVVLGIHVVEHVQLGQDISQEHLAAQVHHLVHVEELRRLIHLHLLILRWLVLLRLLRVSRLQRQRSVEEQRALEQLDRVGNGLRVLVRDETKGPWFATLLVFWNVDFFYGTTLGKNLQDIGV